MSEIGRQGREINGPEVYAYPNSWPQSLEPAATVGGASDEITNSYMAGPEQPDHDRPGREVAARFAADIEASRTPRVDRYLSALGLRVATMATITEDRHDEVDRVLTEITGEDTLTQEMGVYFPYVDMGFIFRDEHLERWNGTDITDSIRVHEGAHGSSRHRLVIPALPDNPTQYIVPRTGLSVTTMDGMRLGDFLEEAWAEHIRGRYIAEELGKPTGFANWGAEYIKTRDPRDGTTLHIPARYASNQGVAVAGISDASFAGAAFDRLVQRDPGLEAAAIEARGSVEGLREVAGRLNRIDEGLYQRLQRMPAGDDMITGLKHVQAVLGIA